jgi:hypothetical protein
MVRRESRLVCLPNTLPSSEGSFPAGERDKRTASLAALERGIDFLQYTNPVEKTDVRNLTTHEEWMFSAIQNAVCEVPLKRGSNTFKRTWFDQQTQQEFTLYEGIPTDDLIDWLRSQNNKTAEITPDELPLRLGRNEVLTSLERYSVPFRDCHRDLTDEQFAELFVSRVRLEEQFIANDSRNTGDPVQNRQIAEQAMAKRLEFRPPADIAGQSRTVRKVKELFDTSFGDCGEYPPLSTDRKRNMITKSRIAITGATAFPAAVAMGMTDHDRPITIAAAAVATGTSLWYEHWQETRKRQDDGSVVVEQLQKDPKTIADDILRTSIVPVLGNVIGPSAAVEIINQLPSEDVINIAKGAIAAAALRNYWRVFNLLKLPFQDIAMKKIRAEAKSPHETYEPFTWNTEDPQQHARQTIRDAFDLLVDLHPNATFRPYRFKDTNLERQLVGDMNEVIAKLLRCSFPQPEARDDYLAYVRYDALYGFARFIHQYGSLYQKHLKYPTILNGEHAAINAMRLLEHIAIGIFDDPKSAFQIDEDEPEFTKYDEYEEEGAGLTFLLNHQAQRSDDDPKKLLTEIVTQHPFMHVYSQHIDFERQLKTYIKGFHELSRRDTTERSMTRNWGEVAGGLTHVLFDFRERARRKRNNIRQRTIK